METQRSKSLFAKLKQTVKLISAETADLKKSSTELHYGAAKEQSRKHSKDYCNELANNFEEMKKESEKLMADMMPKISITREYFYDMEDLYFEIEETIGEQEKHLQKFGYKPVEIQQKSEVNLEIVPEQEVKDLSVSTTDCLPLNVTPELHVNQESSGVKDLDCRNTTPKLRLKKVSGLNSLSKFEIQQNYSNDIDGVPHGTEWQCSSQKISETENIDYNINIEDLALDKTPELNFNYVSQTNLQLELEHDERNFKFPDNLETSLPSTNRDNIYIAQNRMPPVSLESKNELNGDQTPEFFLDVKMKTRSAKLHHNSLLPTSNKSYLLKASTAKKVQFEEVKRVSSVQQPVARKLDFI